MKTNFVISLILLIYSINSFSVDFFTIVKKDCSSTSGVIVHVDDKNIQVLNKSGEYENLSTENITLILNYNLPNNPIKNIKKDPEANKKLKSIYVKENSDEVYLVGHAIKFIEDLSVFLDVEGNQHVLGADQIGKIRPYELKSSKKLNFTEYGLFVEEYVPSCPKLKDVAGSEVIRPSRIIGDKIQISEFLSNYKRGYEKLIGFEERTYFYARPFLFPERFRFSIPIFEREDKNDQIRIPVAFQYSFGKDYHFQTFNKVGKSFIRWTPQLDPLMVAQSELKSHIFHGVVIANIAAIPAGYEYFNKREAGSLVSDVVAGSHFNHLILIGVDYGNYSFSIGNFQPIHLLKSQQENSPITLETREVLSSKVAPIFRLMYTEDKYRFFTLFSQFKYGSNPTELDQDVVVMESPNGKQSILGSFSFKGFFVRSGFDYNFTKRTTLGFDVVYHEGDYSEEYVGTSNQMDFKHYKSQLALSNDIGRFVTLKGMLSYHYEDYFSNFEGFSQTPSRSSIGVGGVLELLY